MAGDLTQISGTATTAQTAQYLSDLIDAKRISDGSMPVKFKSARRIKYRVPTGEPTVFMIRNPNIGGVEGIKILAEETEKDEAGTKLTSESILGWYVYGESSPWLLDIIQDY